MNKTGLQLRAVTDISSLREWESKEQHLWNFSAWTFEVPASEVTTQLPVNFKERVLYDSLVITVS